MGCVLWRAVNVHRLTRRAEDQQRINSFSKLNTRHRNILDKLEVLKVRRCERRVAEQFFMCMQQEKEALDDLSMELELADEDQDVMSV